jgi:hypothetical protein
VKNVEFTRAFELLSIGAGRVDRHYIQKGVSAKPMIFPTSPIVPAFKIPLLPRHDQMGNNFQPVSATRRTRAAKALTFCQRTNQAFDNPRLRPRACSASGQAVADEKAHLGKVRPLYERM